MEKKVFKLLLLTMILLLSSCSSPNVEKKEEKTNNPISTKENTTSENDEKSSNENDSFDPIPVFDKTSTVDPQVLYDEKEMKIELKKMEYNDYSVEITMAFSNKSKTDLRVLSQSGAISKNTINGFMAEGGYINVDVEAGKTVEDIVEYSYDSLSIYGIDGIGELSFDFNIDAKDYTVDYKEFETGALVVKTSNFDKYQTKETDFFDRITSKAIENKFEIKILDKNKDNVFEQNGIAINSIVQMENKDSEKIVLLELNNTSKAEVGIYTNDIKLDDKLISEGLWSYEGINPSKRSIMDISVSRLLEEEEWKKLNINEPKKLTFIIKAKNEDGNDIIQPTEINIDLK